jgi:predicted nucleic acid-binding protein
MTTYYLDTSALSKRYVQESGSQWMRELTKLEPSHLFLTSRLTMIEFYSALARRRLEGSVPAIHYEIIIRAFDQHATMEYDFVELNLDVVGLAYALLQNHALRANDAVQLASALYTNNILVAKELPPLTFIAADEKLNVAAQAEGLIVENPNFYY